MIKQCSKCHKEFNAISEEMDVCRDCLSDEFGQADVMTEEDKVEFERETRNNFKRQMARVERMNLSYSSDSVFNNSGKLRCTLGVILFLICAVIFIIGDSETARTPINQLDPISQRIFSMCICSVAVGLILLSVRRHKLLILSVSAFMLAVGWYMPTIWHYRGLDATSNPDETLKVQNTDAGAEVKEPTNKDPEPVLKESDLEPFRKAESEAPRLAHYAIYINDQNSATRNVVRDAFTRLLQAGYTKAFSRAEGALYVVANVQGKRRQITGVLERLGQVTYARPDQGIYEVKFDPEKANMVSLNTSEELTSPSHPSFVSANLRELHCLDVSRVRQAAINLKNADVPVLRTDIRDTLISVLRESWSSELDTYATLVEALMVYSPEGDKQVHEICRRYFQTCRLMRRSTSQLVIKRLIEEDPDSMVEPVLEQWCSNPIAWNSMLDSLGSRVEDKMLAVLEQTPDDNIRMLDNIIQFLQRHGSEKSIPAVQRYLNHKDQVIQHVSERTLQELKSRSGK